jgi:hypothetical protein
MKLVNLFSCATFFALCIQAVAQSDTPCSSSVLTAPALPVNTTCSFTNGTTVGATLQTDAANAGVPACGSMSPDVFYSFVAPATGTVMITTASGTITDGVMALYSGSCGAWTELGCSDDVNAAMPQLSQTGLTPGTTYLIRFWQFAGGTGTFNICVRSMVVSNPGNNTTCAVLNPLCSGSPYALLANSGVPAADATDPGNQYGCMGTSPNPSWFYLQISQAGDLVIDIAAGQDIDYAIWGPFANLANAQANCNSYPAPLDCSYSPWEVEQATVNGVAVGQIYALLVTNYANSTQVISITANAANTAGTDCSIISLPVDYSRWELESDNGEVLLTWTTENEKDNGKFFIQRSASGLVWETIGVVAGHGTSLVAHAYRFRDENPMNGISYYRLQQVDINGNPSFTGALSANVNATESFLAYPNPAEDHFTIPVSGKKTDGIIITNTIGIAIKAAYTETTSSVNVDCSKLAPGIYTVTVLSQDSYRSGKLMIRR